MMKMVHILIFLMCCFAPPTVAKETSPDGFEALVGKTLYTLIVIADDPPGYGEPTEYYEESGVCYKGGPDKRYSLSAPCQSAPATYMPVIYQKYDPVTITKVEWKKDEAIIWLAVGQKEKGTNVTIHFSNPANFWQVHDQVFTENDPRKLYSFELQSGGLQYSDEIVDITFTPSFDGIGVKIKNNLDLPLKIDWASGSFVDVTGEAHGIIHSGIKLANKEDYQKPTTIPPKASVTDVIVPTTYVDWIENHWEFRALFPPTQKKAVAIDGKTISIFLPIQIAGREDHNLNIPLKVTLQKK